jgi:SAM-dependent methyltransferase
MFERFRRLSLCAAAPCLILAQSTFSGFGIENRYSVFIPYVPTPNHLVDRMLELAEVGKDDLVLDLGSGDGRIVITAAQRYGSRGRGVEIDPKLVDEAKGNAVRAGVADRTDFVAADMFVAPLSDATVVTLYVLTASNLELRPRLLKELRPGARVVSHAFSMGGWLADRHENLGGVDLYLWIVPAQVDGKWDLSDGRNRYTVTIEQEYQEIRGTASTGKAVTPLRQAKLRGDEIDFALDFGHEAPVWYRGKISGDTIVPRNAVGDVGRGWSAKRLAPAPAPTASK